MDTSKSITLLALLCVSLLESVRAISCNTVAKPHMHYREFMHRKPASYPGVKTVEPSVPSVAVCAQHCTDHTQFICQSFTYSKKICILSPSVVGTANYPLIFTFNEIYYQATCTSTAGSLIIPWVPSPMCTKHTGSTTSAEAEVDLAWTVRPFTSPLASQALTVLTTTVTLDKCMDLCANMTGQCASLTYNENTGTCTLYSEATANVMYNSGTESYYTPLCIKVPEVGRCAGLRKRFVWQYYAGQELLASSDPYRNATRSLIQRVDVGYLSSCVDACLNKAECKSFDYSDLYKTCDLYSFTGPQIKKSPVNFGSKQTEYYEEQCVDGLGAVTTCLNGNVRQWTTHTNTELTSGADFIRSGVTLADCQTLCFSYPFGCRSIQYAPTLARCRLSKTSPSPAAFSSSTISSSEYSLHIWTTPCPQLGNLPTPAPTNAPTLAPGVTPAPGGVTPAPGQVTPAPVGGQGTTTAGCDVPVVNNSSFCFTFLLAAFLIMW